MATYYVGPGGNNGNSGTTWAQRKETLNGAEDIPVAAGDTVYVGPGVYRETLTIDVSGSSGNPIAYIGDYTGANTDGVGGVVRITGSDNDQTASRNNCITATSRNYRTFEGFHLLMTSNTLASFTDCTYVVLTKCFMYNTGGQSAVTFGGASSNNNTIRRCVINSVCGQTATILFTHTSTVNDTNNIVENCLLYGGLDGVRSVRVGGITVRNTTITLFSNRCINVQTALAGGQTITVNNCILSNSSTGLGATVTGEITENYNSISCSTARTNVSSGDNSNTYLAAYDSRWAFELFGGGNLATPFDLPSYSPLVELNSGTGAPANDMRGAAQVGSYREWGALEYDSSLKIAAGSGGGGPVVGSRIIRGLGAI